jgi:hypothetical protein
MLNKILISSAAAFASLAAIADNTFTYDGRYDANEYDLSFDIEYTVDDGVIGSGSISRTISGGTLAFANHDGKQYMYISHPLGFKDLSYGEGSNGGNTCDKDCEKAAQETAKIEYEQVNGKCSDKPKAEKKSCEADRKQAENDAKAAAIANGAKGATSADDYLVGWMNSDQKDADKAVGSEYMELSFQSGDNTYTLNLDPSVPDKENKLNGNDVKLASDFTPIANSLGNGLNVSFLSTLNYNASLLNNGDFYGGLGEYEDHSPETIDCPLGESSSDKSCYELADGVDSRITDWEFEWGLEVELSKQLVDISSLKPENFAFGLDRLGTEVANNTILVSLNSLHASDPKSPWYECGQGAFTNQDTKPGGHAHEPCDAKVTPQDPTPPEVVSEPSALALLGIGMYGIWYRRKKAV